MDGFLLHVSRFCSFDKWWAYCHPVQVFGQGALLAQWLERAAVNRKVTGSIPVGSARFYSKLVRLK